MSDEVGDAVRRVEPVEHVANRIQLLKDQLLEAEREAERHRREIDVMQRLIGELTLLRDQMLASDGLAESGENGEDSDSTLSYVDITAEGQAVIRKFSPARSMALNVRMILREAGRPLTAKEVADIAIAKGLTNVRNRVHTALHSMKNTGKLHFDEHDREYSIPE